ncbi:hypothetical protein LguiA_034586 [Lonicera macranthoides]
MYNFDYETAESSTASDGSSTTAAKSDYSGEQVLMLAFRNPKRRAGRKKFNETRHPVYRGIRKRNGGKWVCEVREPNKKNSRIWLGTFPTAQMAARAYDVAAIAFGGSSACLNFSDSIWRLPVPATASAKDIQKEAAEAADIFRLSESEQSESGSTSGENLMEESVGESPDNSFYADEEAVFGMPGLLVDMAEGLMVPPPLPPVSWVGDDEDAFIGDEVCLWNY